MSKLAIGDMVVTAKGTEGTIAQILEGGYLLDSGKRVRAELIASIIPLPKFFRFTVGSLVYIPDTYHFRYGQVGRVVSLSNNFARVCWDDGKMWPYELNELVVREVN